LHRRGAEMARPLDPRPHDPALRPRAGGRESPGSRSGVRLDPQKHPPQVRAGDAIPPDQPDPDRQARGGSRPGRDSSGNGNLKRLRRALSLPHSGERDFMLKYLLAGTALLLASTANAETYAIQAGRLIVDAAQAERGPSTVIVENGRVSRIEAGFTAPAGAIVVDERNRTVMPGMTDVHVHLTQTAGTPWYSYYTQKYSNAYATTLGLTHALEMARGGFTTVRDLGGDTSSVIAVRDAVAEGRFPGPRIKVSGAPLSIVGGHADAATGLPPELAGAINEAHLNPSVCTGVEECQKVVRQLAAAGVDVIKIMATGGVL